MSSAQYQDVDASLKAQRLSARKVQCEELQLGWLLCSLNFTILVYSRGPKARHLNFGLLQRPGARRIVFLPALRSMHVFIPQSSTVSFMRRTIPNRCTSPDAGEPGPASSSIYGPTHPRPLQHEEAVPCLDQDDCRANGYLGGCTCAPPK